MRNRSGKLDITKPFPADALLCNFNATTVTDYTLVFNTLVLTTVTFPILLRSEDRLTEKPFGFRSKGTVINCFCLLDLAAVTCAFLRAYKGTICSVGRVPTSTTGLLRRVFNLLRRSYLYGDAVKCRVHQFSFFRVFNTLTA